ITAEVHVPTIGIGAGPECDGQVLVLHDMLNLTFAPRAKFVRQYADVAGNIRQALESYKADVEAGTFPGDQESYHLPADTRSALEHISERKRALHAGHLALVRAARAQCPATAVSIFVNPTQFGPNEDFAKYPHTLEGDQKMIEAEGISLLFVPTVEEMYPPGAATFVNVEGL